MESSEIKLTTQPLRVLELYSGIGGMHYALKESGAPFEVVMAVDINTSANNIYRHNFPGTQLHSFGIEKLSLKSLSKLKIDAIVMSPPCQPFTRVGKKRDCDDVRTKSFLHVMELLKQLTKKPTYLLVENVKGFEESLTHSQLMACLEECGYQFQQFLLTPLQFGIPNCRLRYYLIARLDQAFDFCFTEHPPSPPPKHKSPTAAESCIVNQSNPSSSSSSLPPIDNDYIPNKRRKENIIIKDISPFVDMKSNIDKHNGCSQFMCLMKSTDSKNGTEKSELSVDKSIEAKAFTSDKKEELRDVGRNMRYCEEDEPFITCHSRPLSDFMETRESEEFKDYLLKDKDLPLFVIMDIVFPSLKKTTCFTKRYGHYIEGAGSVVQMTTDIEAVKAASAFKCRAVEMKNRSEWGEKEMSILKNLKLRYFTPREVANLLCFPPDFDWPQDVVSTIQMYRCLGNSLNVHVVTQLMKLMLQESTHKTFDVQPL